MAEIFSGYLKIGFWTAFVIGGALLLLPHLSRRYTAKLPYAVWLVLTLRLLCPVGLSIPMLFRCSWKRWTLARYGRLASRQLSRLHKKSIPLRQSCQRKMRSRQKKQAGFRSLRLWISLRQFGLLAQASLWHGLHGGRFGWHIF